MFYTKMISRLKRASCLALIRFGIVVLLCVLLFPRPTLAAPTSAEKRGLLASPGFEGRGVKGIYFFPGESAGNTDKYTTHPTEEDDKHWNSDPASRGRVLDRMVRANANTVVMSYWSNMPQWCPMVLDGTSVSGVIEAVQGRPLVIMPAMEGGYDENNPATQHWEFNQEFPSDVGGLVYRVGLLVTLFNGHMDKWAQLYDRDGLPRYAVNILHVSSTRIEQVPGSQDDEIFARAFDTAADAIFKRYKIRVGFTLDTIGDQRYSALPSEAGPALERTASVLAIQGFASEVFNSVTKRSKAGKAPHDNNHDGLPPVRSDNIERMADWKRAAVNDWVKTGVPVILDVNNGFDGRKVWSNTDQGIWGDNTNYTEDRWRNWMSQLKGPGIKGICFDTWNGYTEGYAAVPSEEHGDTVYKWLRELLAPPPWEYSDFFYVNGKSTYRVYGAICDKWHQLGADRRFAAPVSAEAPASFGRVQYFGDGKAIYWSGATGAHEVHGQILKTYQQEGAEKSCLGFPISDEEGSRDNRVNRFENGRIEWKAGDAEGRVICNPAPTGQPAPSTGFIGVFSQNPPDYQPMWVYGISDSGSLVWYRKEEANSPWQGPKTVGAHWDQFKDVIAAGGNRFYALTNDGRLMWLQDNDFNTGQGFSNISLGRIQIPPRSGNTGAAGGNNDGQLGGNSQSNGNEILIPGGGNNNGGNGGIGPRRPRFTPQAFSLENSAPTTNRGHFLLIQGPDPNQHPSPLHVPLITHGSVFPGTSHGWNGPLQVGKGWDQYKKIFSGGDGVIYAIRQDGALMWFRHNAYETGGGPEQRDAWSTSKQIASGWGNYKDVFSTGGGDIYAIQNDGYLVEYQHNGYLTGESNWGVARTVGLGWQNFRQVVPAANGVLLAIKPDGKMMWYKHLGPALTGDRILRTERWQGPIEIGSGWQNFKKVVVLLPVSELTGPH